MEYVLGAFALFFVVLVLLRVTDGSNVTTAQTKWSPHCDNRCRVVSSDDLGYTYSQLTYDVDHSTTCQARAQKAHDQARREPT